MRVSAGMVSRLKASQNVPGEDLHALVDEVAAELHAIRGEILVRTAV
jgi:hypothetical protein